MATIRELEAALINADRAGDTQAATALAAEIDRLLGRVVPAAAPEPAPVERTFMGQIGEGLRGIPRGAIGLLETAGIGASALLPDEEESYLREIISGAAERAASPFQRKPGYEDSMAGTFGEVAGSFLPLMATGALGLAGRAAATGLAGAAGAGTARTRAEQGGATPEERAKATALGTAVGLSEVLVPFRILDNALDATAATTIFNRIKRAGITGGAEGAQEAAAEVAQNLIEKGLYDPEQGVFVGTGESFGYGAGVGGLVQGLFDLFVKDRSAAGAPPPAEEPTTPTEEQLQAGDLFPEELEAATSDEQMVAAAMARRQAQEENDLALREEDAEAAELQGQEQLDMFTPLTDADLDKAGVPKAAAPTPVTPATGFAADNARALTEALRTRNPELLRTVEKLHAKDKTAAEIAALVNMDVDTIRALRLGMGLPDQGKPAGSVTGFTVPGDADVRKAFESWRDAYNKTAMDAAKAAARAKAPAAPVEPVTPAEENLDDQRLTPEEMVPAPMTDEEFEAIGDTAAPVETVTPAEEAAAAEVAPMTPAKRLDLARLYSALSETPQQDVFFALKEIEAAGLNIEAMPTTTAVSAIRYVARGGDPKTIGAGATAPAPAVETTTPPEAPVETAPIATAEPAQATYPDQDIRSAAEELQLDDMPAKGKATQWLGNLRTSDPETYNRVVAQIEGPALNAVQPKREEAASIPANQRIMQLVEQGATPAQILRAITQDKDLPQALRDMAAQMLRVAPNINVPVISRRFEAPDEVGEYVHPSKGDEAIYLDPRAESVAQTFVHEFIHAATVNGIARGVPAGRRLKEMFDAYKAATPEADTYGLTNVYEFVAEALTNPKFQVELKSRNLKGAKKSYWDSFVDFVKNILGIQQRGPLEEILDLTKDLAVQQDKVWQAAERALTDQTPAANVRFLNVQGAQLKKASTPVKAPRFKRAVAALFDKGQEAVTKTMIWGLGIDQINDYVQSYIKKKGPNYEPFAASFNRFTQITGKLEGEMRQFIDGITAQVARMGDWRNSHPDLYEDMNALVYGGTLDKVDLTKPKSTYVGNPDKLKAYDRLKKIYDKLEPSGGAAVYRQMRAIYNRVFNNISQQVYDRVYSETQDANLATTIKNKFTEQMKLSGLEGYAALTRNNGKYRIKYFLPKSDVPYFETFENSADWNARQKQLLEEDGVNPKDMQPFLHGDQSVFDGIVPTSFMGDLVQTLKNKGASDDVLQAVMELGISVSPAQVVMERLAKRKETPGYTVDAFAAFQESVVGLQRKLINMKYGAQMSKEVRDMRATRKNVPTDPNVDYFIGEAASRAEYAANPNQNLISNVLTTGTYGWTLGLNVSSAIVDMMSLIVTGGYLSGKFKSRRKAHAALVKAGRDILGMGTTADVETMVTQGLEGDALKEALATAGITERDVARRRVAPSMLNIDFNNPEQAKKYGYLRALVNKVQQQGHSERFSDLEERAEFGETNWISKIAARMGFMMSTSERFKRETGLKAYYDLALAEVAPNGDPTKATPEQMEKAANDAMEMSRLLNGGSTPVTGPGFQRDNFWRVAFMYRSFAFRQMYVQVKTLYDATMNDEKVVRDAARKFGSTVLLTSGALVGVQGMPLFGPVALLLNVLAQPFVDDEEEEKFVQNMLRSNLDPLIYEGLPNALLNMNVSERASLTDLLARDTNLPDDATFAETLAAHFGGPAFGSIERGLRGWRLIEQGQVQRGIESMVPTTLASILKSIRFATDGAAETLRGDDVIQISPVAVVSQFLGFTPADYARTMEFKSVQAGIDRRVAERKSNLYAAAYAAYRVGDSAGLAQVMQKMIEFNQKFPAEAITSEGLRQSLRTRDRNSADMLGGTLPRESRRSEWQEAADDWGVQFPE